MDEPQVGSTFVDKYEFLQPLGRSGNGNSYKIKERGTGKLLVVKILSDELQQNEKRMAAMKSGTRVAAALVHANVAKTIEFTKDRSYGFYVLRDFVEGRTLTELLKSKGVLNQVEFMDIFYQAASGLAYLHRKGYVHGQLKPNNIMISTDYAVKVVDVGVRRNIVSAPDGSEVIGDAYYLSPEQCLGQGFDQRADIYSFACMMYEALSQNKPYVGLNSAEIRQQQIKQSPTPFAELVPARKVDSQIESVIMRCLAKDPAARYPSFDILQSDLRRIEQGEDIKPIPKNTGLPATVLVAAALFLILLIAGGVSFYFSINGKHIANNQIPLGDQAETSASESADEKKADDLCAEKNYSAAAEIFNRIEPIIGQQQGTGSRQHLRVLHKLAKAQLYAHDVAAARDTYGVLVQNILQNPGTVPPGYLPQMEVYAISKELLAADSLAAAGRGFSLAFELDKMMNGAKSDSPTRYHFLIWEAKCHEKQKNFDAAEDCLEKSLRIFRANGTDPRNLAFALTEYGREQMDRAESSPDAMGDELKLMRSSVSSLNEAVEILREQNLKAELRDTRRLLIEARRKFRELRADHSKGEGSDEVSDDENSVDGKSADRTVDDKSAVKKSSAMKSGKKSR